MPCSISALVIAPVPGPSSTTGPSDSTSTYCAMVRASTRLEGITAPICSGFSIHERRKRTSSSRRRGFFNARADDCNGMSLPGGTARAVVRKQSQRGIGPGRYGQAKRLLQVAAVAEEVLDLSEETRRFRLRRTGRQFFELHQ